MPTYDYICKDCNNTFEQFHSMNEKGSSKCPNCKSKNIKIQFSSGSGVIFKGSGFYVNDSKKGIK